VAIPLFHCDGSIYVPLGKRSPSMNLYPNLFGIPCEGEGGRATAISKHRYQELLIAFDKCMTPKLES
jgi:hypothetical protein